MHAGCPDDRVRRDALPAVRRLDLDAVAVDARHPRLGVDIDSHALKPTCGLQGQAVTEGPEELLVSFDEEHRGAGGVDRAEVLLERPARELGDLSRDLATRRPTTDDGKGQPRPALGFRAPGLGQLEGREDPPPQVERIVAEAAGAECDRAGRVAVRPDCTLPGHPEVFVVGDAMTLDGLPGVAAVATQQGIYVARTIRRRLEGKHAKPFRYRDPGSMAAIGRGRAIVSFHGLRYGGLLGFLSWLFVHLAFLTGFRNRVGALISWSWAFIGRSRNQRTFTVEEIGGSDIYGRGAPQGSTRALTELP